MADDLMHKAAVSARTDGGRREQLREPAILRDVVNIDFRTAAAILAIVGTQKRAPFVDLQRLPRIEHRGGLEEARGYRIFRVGHIDNRHTITGGIPGRRTTRGRRTPVIGANAPAILAFSLALAIAVSEALTPLGRLPVGAIVFDLAEKLEV